MRRWLLILGGALLFVATATPAQAAWTYEPFTVSPVAGPPGTEITVEGDCQESQPGVAALRIAGTGQTLDFAFFGQGPFRVTLTNTVPASTFPVELEVEVDCFGLKGRPQPFSSTPHPDRRSEPRIFTTPGPGPCGVLPACRAHVKGFDDDGVMQTINRYVHDWRRGASVAVGDLNGDRRFDVVLGSGPEPGRWAELAVMQPDIRSQLFPMDRFDGGINIAVGDVDGNGVDEMIVAAGPGGGPHVKVLTLNMLEMASFFAYDPSFRGGVSVAAADLNGDGRDEIITGAGPGGAPHVRVFDGAGQPAGPEFLAYDAAFRGGINVAGGNLVGTRNAKIVTAPGPGGSPHIRTFTSTGAPIGVGFYAYDPGFLGGISVAVGDVSGFRDFAIVTAPFSGGDPHVRLFSGEGVARGPGFYAYGNYASGVRVAVPS
ncbi:MAG: VCBS repeat-containing protein [Acidimicrobiales bacterium]|nr:VCBS repeat-containing protein [Acidimicrobiales bacterium]